MTTVEASMAIVDADRFPLNWIQPSTTNPRKTFTDTGLIELAESIKKYGILMPILARKMPMETGDESPRYEIIAGERRYRASKLAGLPSIPCRVIEVSDLEVLELQIIENLQREDLHPLEEADSYEALLKAHASSESYGVEEVAAKLGKSRAYIYARMKLCALIPQAREAFYAGKLNASTALLIARIPVPTLQTKALEEITQVRYAGDSMSFREAARHVQDNYMTRLDQAVFKIADATLVPAAGECTTCPKRTGANPDLFDDVGRADVCTDPVCFADKKAAHATRLRIAAVESGKKVITGKEAKKIKPNRWDQPKGYLQPNDSPWWVESQKSIKKSLGKAMPATVLLEDPDSGDMIELVPEDQVRSALRDAGIKMSRCSSPAAAQNRENDAKVKAERAYRRAVLRAVHDAAAADLSNGGSLQTFDLQTIADYAFMRLGSDTRPTVAELWGWPAKDVQACRDALGSLAHADLELLLIDIALASETYVNSWWSGDGSAEDLEATANRYAIDTKAIRKSLAPAKKAAKKKPVVKKVAVKKAVAKAPAKATRSSASPVPVKYRDLDTGATWSGRGKAPRWITLAEEAGHIREEFLTQEAAQKMAADAEALTANVNAALEESMA